MEITNLNFIENLPEISDAIKNCDFIAIDTELSGLMRERSLGRFDLPEERFAKSVDLSRGYFILQFGLSCFKCTDRLKYTTRTYNFYIFPQVNTGHGDKDRTLCLQAHAIQFLSQHGFDFNKLFRHGISYLTFQEKKALTAKLKSDDQNRSNIETGPNGLPKFIPASMVQTYKKWLKETKKFIYERKLAHKEVEAANESPNNDDESPSETTEVPKEDPDRLLLRSCCTNQKRSLFKRLIEIQPYFESIDLDEAQDPESNETYTVLRYIGKDMKQEKEKNAMLLAKGFLEILECMIINKKPIVGHNLSIDLIQIFNQFLEPITDDYKGFKSFCKSLFPIIYDTKYIAHSILEPDSLTNNQSRLYDLYVQVRDGDTLPKVKVDHEGEFFDENQMPHQAGYDAYMSGYCFIGLCEGYLKEHKSDKKQKREEVQCKPRSIANEDQIREEFANRIHLSYSYDFKYFDLDGEEDIPDRHHVFYLECPDSWKLDDIFQLFHPFGGVSVGRLNASSALCALRDVHQVQRVTTLIRDLSKVGQNYKLFTYETYLRRFKPKKQEVAGNDGDTEFYLD